jgi:hypothetical protein
MYFCFAFKKTKHADDGTTFKIKLAYLFFIC